MFLNCFRHAAIRDCVRVLGSLSTPDESPDSRDEDDLVLEFIDQNERYECIMEGKK